MREVGRQRAVMRLDEIIELQKRVLRVPARVEKGRFGSLIDCPTRSVASLRMPFSQARSATVTPFLNLAMPPSVSPA